MQVQVKNNKRKKYYFSSKTFLTLQKQKLMKKIIFILLLAVSVISCKKETTTPQPTEVKLNARLFVQSIPNNSSVTGVWVQLETSPVALPENITATVQFDLFNGINQFVSTHSYKSTLQANINAFKTYSGVLAASNWTTRNVKIISIEFFNPNFVVKY